MDPAGYFLLQFLLAPSLPSKGHLQVEKHRHSSSSAESAASACGLLLLALLQATDQLRGWDQQRSPCHVLHGRVQRELLVLVHIPSDLLLAPEGQEGEARVQVSLHHAGSIVLVHVDLVHCLLPHLQQRCHFDGCDRLHWLAPSGIASVDLLDRSSLFLSRGSHQVSRFKRILSCTAR